MPHPIARISQMFDPLNQMTVDAIIDSKATGERELAAFQFLKLMPKDLILLDRGYPAYWIFNLIISQGADFCARVQRKRWKIIRQFYNSVSIGTKMYPRCRFENVNEKWADRHNDQPITDYSFAFFIL